MTTSENQNLAERLISPAEEEMERRDSILLRQIFGVGSNGTPTAVGGAGHPVLNQRESLNIKKMLHSLMSLSSPVPEFGANAMRQSFQHKFY